MLSIPLAVPEKIIGLTKILDFFDRCDSFASLYPPLAALGSLPLFGNTQQMLRKIRGSSLIVSAAVPAPQGAGAAIIQDHRRSSAGAQAHMART